MGEATPVNDTMGSMDAAAAAAAAESNVFCFSFLIHPPADGQNKLKLTTLPRIFIHVVCRFNSIAFAIQLVFWRVLRFP